MAVYQMSPCCKINTADCVTTQEEIDEVIEAVTRVYERILRKRHPGARFKIVDKKE